MQKWMPLKLMLGVAVLFGALTCRGVDVEFVNMFNIGTANTMWVESKFAPTNRYFFYIYQHQQRFELPEGDYFVNYSPANQVTNRFNFSVTNDARYRMRYILHTQPQITPGIPIIADEYVERTGYGYFELGCLLGITIAGGRFLIGLLLTFRTGGVDV